MQWTYLKVFTWTWKSVIDSSSICTRMAIILPPQAPLPPFRLEFADPALESASLALVGSIGMGLTQALSPPPPPASFPLIIMPLVTEASWLLLKEESTCCVMAGILASSPRPHVQTIADIIPVPVHTAGSAKKRVDSV